MPPDPAGPGPPAPRAPWAREDVERWLKVAFRQMPFTNIYAPRGNMLESMSPGKPSATFDIVAFSGTVLGDRSRERRIVLIWARAIVTEGSVGGSITEYCLANDMERRQFDRIRIKACQRIADAKNVADRTKRDAA